MTNIPVYLALSFPGNTFRVKIQDSPRKNQDNWSFYLRTKLPAFKSHCVSHCTTPSNLGLLVASFISDHFLFVKICGSVRRKTFVGQDNEML